MSKQNTTLSMENSEQISDKVAFTLEIFKIIKESQQQHGLRHSDYMRYRSYCTRRIRRLRKTLNFVCGNQKRYQKREIQPEDMNDMKYLLIPLYQAERSWAYAMELKQEANSEPRKRFHLRNKLRKSIKYTSELEKLSMSGRCDARTKLEAQGYNAWMSGQFYFEVEKWPESLKHFTLAKNIYDKLAQTTLIGDDLQLIYKQRADEITPNIRYCSYNIGNDEDAINDLINIKLSGTGGSELTANIDALLSQTKEKQIKTMSEVNWRGKVLQVKHEKVRLYLLNVQEYDQQIQSTSSYETKLDIFENILKESLDALQILRDELRADPNFKLIQRGKPLEDGERPSNLLLLFSYLNCIRLKHTIDRTLVMISKQGTFNKPQDAVRLYDIIIQNYRDLSNLIGVSDDLEYQAEIEQWLKFYKAHRAYFICLSFLQAKRFKEAAGFSLIVDKYIKEAKSKDLSQLKQNLNETKFKIQTGAFIDVNLLHTDEDGTQQQKQHDLLSKIPLVDRLDTFYEDSSLVTPQANIIKIPSDFEAIPCKPLFFDLALNHVELPSLDDKIDSKKTQAQSASVKGFFKSFLGFK